MTGTIDECWRRMGKSAGGGMWNNNLTTIPPAAVRSVVVRNFIQISPYPFFPRVGGKIKTWRLKRGFALEKQNGENHE